MLSRKPTILGNYRSRTPSRTCKPLATYGLATRNGICRQSFTRCRCTPNGPKRAPIKNLRCTAYSSTRRPASAMLLAKHSTRLSTPPSRVPQVSAILWSVMLNVSPFCMTITTSLNGRSCLLSFDLSRQYSILGSLQMRVIQRFPI